MMTPKKLFDSIGGFNLTFREYYFDVDYCLRVQRAHDKRVLYVPNARVVSNLSPTFNDITNVALNKEDLNEFQRIWSPILEDEVMYSVYRGVVDSFQKYSPHSTFFFLLGCDVGALI
jgi:hypothetical protein